MLVCYTLKLEVPRFNLEIPPLKLEIPPFMFVFIILKLEILDYLKVEIQILNWLSQD